MGDELIDIINGFLYTFISICGSSRFLNWVHSLFKSSILKINLLHFSYAVVLRYEQDVY